MHAVRTALIVAGLAAAGTAQGQDEEGPGFALYQQHCRTCHVMEPGDNRLGPSLHGIVGARAGAVEGFAYSRSMAASRVVWDEAALDAFLADPKGFMPGNRMQYQGMAEAADRAAVIAYMAGEE
jgi:cytochrome c